MEFDGCSDDEDREARMYAMLHYVDSENAHPVSSNGILEINNCYTNNDECVINSNNNLLKSDNLSPDRITCISEISTASITKTSDFVSNLETSKDNTVNYDSPKSSKRKSKDLEQSNNLISNTSENISIIDNSKNNSSIIKQNITDNLEKSKNVDSIIKRVTHTGRYWVTHPDTANKEVNSKYKKINNSSKKSPTQPTGKKPFVIILNDKWSSNRKSSESISPVVYRDTSQEINESLPQKKSKTLNRSSLKSAIKGIPKSQKGKTSVRTESETKNALSKNPHKKSKKLSALLQTLDPETDAETDSPVRTLLSPRTKQRNAEMKKALKVHIARAESSFKKKYAKALRNPFSKWTNVDPSIITLDSSDGESVVEVELPVVRPTTIELDSSDENPLENTNCSLDVNKKLLQPSMSTSGTQTEIRGDQPQRSEQAAPLSPVPSIVSSVSDDFIQGDCSSLNLSTETTDLTFNFGLHGTDLCGEPIDHTPNKLGRKSKKTSSQKPLAETESVFQKTSATLTSFTKRSENIPINSESSKETSETSPAESECFATPKSKIKKRRNSKPKNYTVPDQSYVTPSIDVYESESSDIPESLVDVPITPVGKKKKKSFSENFSKHDAVDSTTDITDACCPAIDTLVMANVIGLPNNVDYGVIDVHSDDRSADSKIDISPESNIVSSTVDRKVRSKSRKKSKLEKCVKEMHKYYDTNWGVDFDHVKLKREMPHEKEFWQIDPADKGRPRKPQVTCGYCNKYGHRDDKCYKKPKMCAMCGTLGHKELRCPNKICLSCGSKNNSFSSSCDNCRNWKNMICGICREYGHPSLRCPDIWRRYHLTITNEVPLIEDKRRKLTSQLFCSGCTQRGHIISNCRNYIAFSDFKPPAPYIFHYVPVYTPDGVRNNPKVHQIPQSKASNKNNVKTTSSTPQSPGKRRVFVSPKTSTPKLSKLSISSSIENRNDPIKYTSNSNSVDKLEDSLKIVIQPKDVNSTRKVIISQKTGVETLNLDKDSQLDLNKTTLEPKKIFLDAPKIDIISPKETELQKKDVAVQKNNSSLLENTNNTLNKSTTSDTISENEENETTSHLLLSDEHAIKLANTQGEQFIKDLSAKYNIKAEKCQLKVGTSLVLTGNFKKLLGFQSEIQSWMNVNMSVPPSPNLHRSHISRRKNVAIKQVLRDIDQLKLDLGNPADVFQTIQTTENDLVKCSSKNKVDSIHYTELCKKLNKSRRTLNMILIGQAGLCNGDNMYRKLLDLVCYLQENSSKNVSTSIRDEMGECYSAIFSGTPRNDYPQLIQQFLSNPTFSAHNTFKPQTPVINKIPLNDKIHALLIRLRATINILYSYKSQNPKFRISNMMRFLEGSERRILSTKLSNIEIQAIRNAIAKTQKILQIHKNYISNKNFI